MLNMTTYLYNVTNAIDVAELQKLFAQASWTTRRTPEAIQVMLDNTPVCLGVWDGDRLIGFARAITDDVFRATLEDVIVDEAYRGQGIGGEIVRRMLARLAHVEEIVLACADERIPFYAAHGFERFEMTHMHIWKGD